MIQPIRRAMLILTATVVSLIAATAGQARGGMVVNFSYSGNGGPDSQGFLTNGSGSFSFESSLPGVGLGNLTSFNFTFNESGMNITPNTVTYGLADLVSFTASVGPGPTLTALSLDTRGVVGSEHGSEPREFTVASLNPPLGYTHYVIFGVPIFATSGTVTINSVTSVPEPSSITLAALGALIVAGGWFRHRRATAPA
jgi:hypothetical protein